MITEFNNFISGKTYKIISLTNFIIIFRIPHQGIFMYLTRFMSVACQNVCYSPVIMTTCHYYRRIASIAAMLTSLKHCTPCMHMHVQQPFWQFK